MIGWTPVLDSLPGLALHFAAAASFTQARDATKES
jgi:hypothetical protein